MSKKNGFSLIELLVVITIIGILATIGMMSYRTANQKARDSRRQADIQAIQSALEVYRSQNDQYPGSIDDSVLGSYFTDGRVPTPPDGGVYPYESPYDSSIYRYQLGYDLETDGATGIKYVYNP